MPFWLLAFFAALWLSPAWAAAPTIDGTCQTGAASTACPANAVAPASSITVTFSTVASAGCLVLFISNTENDGNANVAVSSVAKTSGTGTVGTFTKRGSTVTGSGTGPDGNRTLGIEEWSAAYTTALSSAVITVTMASSAAVIVTQGMAVTGTNGNGCTFDPSPRATASGNMTTATLTLTQSTTKANDILFYGISTEAVVGAQYGSFGGVQSNYYTLTNQSTSSGCCGNSLDGGYLGVTAVQSSISTVAAVGGDGAWFAVAFADALTADAVGTAGTRRSLTGAGN